MSTVRLRPAAQSDLNQIFDYSADLWGVGQAESYVTQIRRVAEGLASAGERCPPVDHLFPGMRKARAGSHLIYFLLDEEGVHVVRILHERRDAGPLI